MKTHDEIIYEKLEYLLTKRKGTYFECSQSGININSSVVKSKDLLSDIKSSAKRFWGKHSILSIIVYELFDKAKAYGLDNITENFNDALNLLSSLSCYVKIGTRRWDKLNSDIDILESANTGKISAGKESQLDIAESIFTKFFSSINSDIQKAYYRRTYNDKFINYELMLEKLVAGQYRQIEFSRESTGNHQILRVLCYLLTACFEDIVIIDEADSAVHDYLFKKVFDEIEPFIDGQVIMTTHNTMLMEADFARNATYILSEEERDQDLAKAVETTTVFAKLSPDQKARIILSLKENGHKVGYMGDGINDAPSMKVSDVGISVDTAVDIAKETADVILLDKDLMVLEKGLVEGRKVYANMTKYIKMTVSSNFGNIFSLLFASIFLPFLPMAPVHLIVLNLVYDISCIALPFDNVDKEFLKEPHIWEAKSIMRFMAWFGPISSVFDILTYILLYFIIVPMILGHGYVHGSPEAAAFIIIFQTGWFIESMWSQTMVIHMLRSPKLPFIQSHPALSVVVTTLFAAVFVTSLPYSPLASLLKLSHLNGLYFILLFVIIVLYMLSVTFVKHIYIKKYKEWL